MARTTTKSSTKAGDVENVSTEDLLSRLAQGKALPAGYTFDPRKNPPVFKTADADKVETVPPAAGAGTTTE